MENSAQIRPHSREAIRGRWSYFRRSLIYKMEGREQPDYITVRIPASGVPLALQGSAIYRVHGYLQSRGIPVNLAAGRSQTTGAGS